MEQRRQRQAIGRTEKRDRLSRGGGDWICAAVKRSFVWSLAILKGGESWRCSGCQFVDERTRLWRGRVVAGALMIFDAGVCETMPTTPDPKRCAYRNRARRAGRRRRRRG